MAYQPQYTDIRYISSNGRKPDFNNIQKVLQKQQPSRYTLFEFFHNSELYETVTADKSYDAADPYAAQKRAVDAFARMGYDYANIYASSDFYFKRPEHTGKSTYSISEGSLIYDEGSFNAYEWIEPEDCEYGALEVLSAYMPDGMRLMAGSPGGILENAIAIMGYDNLCYLLADEPQMTKAVFDHIGERLFRYYQRVLQCDGVGIIMCNDDWGFKTQTMLSIADMQRLVFPWYKKIVQLAHDAGRLAVLHSCGAFMDIVPDIVDIGFDGRHSYEDAILRVEDCYARCHNEFAILGGIDVDYIIRSEPADVYNRSRTMLANAATGYALGSGNSIPTYVPTERFSAMIAAALYD